MSFTMYVPWFNLFSILQKHANTFRIYNLNIIIIMIADKYVIWHDLDINGYTQLQ